MIDVLMFGGAALFFFCMGTLYLFGRVPLWALVVLVIAGGWAGTLFLLRDVETGGKSLVPLVTGITVVSAGGAGLMVLIFDVMKRLFGRI